MKNIKLFVCGVLLFYSAIQIYSKPWVNWEEIGASVNSAYHSTVDYVSQITTSTQTLEVKGSGISATRTVKCPDIHSVSVSGQGTLYIQQIEKGDENVVITADDTILPYIQASVKGKTLEIKCRDNLIAHTVIPITYHLAVKNIEKLVTSGNVATQVSKISSDVLMILLSGSSKMDGDIKVNTLDVTGSGSTDVTLSGTAETQKISLSGSGSFDGQNLKGKKAKIDLAGATKVICNISDKISGRASGASNVQYLESPSVVVKISGASSIKRK